MSYLRIIRRGKRGYGEIRQEDTRISVDFFLPWEEKHPGSRNRDGMAKKTYEGLNFTFMENYIARRRQVI